MDYLINMTDNIFYYIIHDFLLYDNYKNLILTSKLIYNKLKKIKLNTKKILQLTNTNNDFDMILLKNIIIFMNNYKKFKYCILKSSDINIKIVVILMVKRCKMDDDNKNINLRLPIYFMLYNFICENEKTLYYNRKIYKILINKLKDFIKILKKKKLIKYKSKDFIKRKIHQYTLLIEKNNKF